MNHRWEWQPPHDLYPVRIIRRRKFAAAVARASRQKPCRIETSATAFEIRKPPRKSGSSPATNQIRLPLSAPPGEARWQATLGRRLAELCTEE